MLQEPDSRLLRQIKSRELKKEKEKIFPWRTCKLVMVAYKEGGPTPLFKGSMFQSWKTKWGGVSVHTEFTQRWQVQKPYKEWMMLFPLKERLINTYWVSTVHTALAGPCDLSHHYSPCLGLFGHQWERLLFLPVCPWSSLINVSSVPGIGDPSISPIPSLWMISLNYYSRRHHLWVRTFKFHGCHPSPVRNTQQPLFHVQRVSQAQAVPYRALGTTNPPLCISHVLQLSP